MADKKTVVLIVEAIMKNSEGKILLLKRSNKNKFFKGLWQLPGGKVDFGENVQEAIEREIMEETGFKKSSPKIHKVFSFYEEFNGFKGEVFLMVFKSSFKGKVVLSEDHSEYKFLSLKKINELNLTPVSEKAIFG